MSHSMLRGAPPPWRGGFVHKLHLHPLQLNSTIRRVRPGHKENFYNHPNNPRSLFSNSKKGSTMATLPRTSLIGITAVVVVGSLTYILYQTDQLQPLPPTRSRSELRAEREKRQAVQAKKEGIAGGNVETQEALPFQVDGKPVAVDDSAWGSFTTKFAVFSTAANSKWGSVTESILDFVMPEWAMVLPENFSKLQKEMSMAPGSLADAIWQEAHDPYINPEIEYSASVRVSSELCEEEEEFLGKRRLVTRVALAKYLGLPEDEVHPDDVPTIAMVGSGGGLRALVAGTGSMLAAGESGLFDCVTYTAGVSGSCWLQALFNSSLGGQRMEKMVDHLKARLGVHIAYPPVALAALNSAPTNKFLLGGFVEKLKGNPSSDFGLVDVYGLLLAARLLVPRGEIGVDDRDLKISNQRDYIKHGEHPMPIYTAVRHEIPIKIPISEEASEEEKLADTPSEEMKTRAKTEAWFQWFEISPFEMFCEEFGAGIPTWSIGRKFVNGKDLPHDKDGNRVPELRLPLLLGVFGSAFCATLSHYYKEVRPLLRGLVGFGGIDGMIEGRNNDLSKVHPILPASIPNFVYKMEDKLPERVPESIFQSSHLQLMDADILIAFDASADIKTENWLSVADGYARQRNIVGWPVGAGWPKQTDTAEKTAGQLEEAQAATVAEANSKVEDAKAEQACHLTDLEKGGGKASNTTDSDDAGDLGHCTIWVGRTEERSSEPEDVKSKAVGEDWELMQPDAGIAVVYFPFISNEKVPGVDPVTSDFMSTWNFVYTPENIDSVVALAKANFEEGKERTRRCVRAVYERKKKQREEVEAREQEARWRRKVRLGIVGKKGEGDHFHLT